MSCLDVLKDGSVIETIELSASKRVYRVGRQQGVADVVLQHGSISREQATLTVSSSGTVVVADLNSAHGTFISGKKLPPNKPHQLPPGRSLTFGQSTRVFKLREGGTGFVTTTLAGDQDASATSGSAQAAAALDNPRVQAVLHVLRNGAPGGERLRPDGFLPLSGLLAADPVQRAGGWTEAELAALPARLSETFEAATAEDGAAMLRDLHGHAAAARVDVSLCLAPCVAPLPEVLIFCTSFKEWNAVRSHGAGAGRDPPTPVRLCTRAPPASYKPASLGRSADLHVYVRVSSLLESGLPLFSMLGEPTTGGAGDGLGGGDDPGAVESIVCVGDEESGAIGPWHFDRVVSARDGCEMMGRDEADALRLARSNQLSKQLAASRVRAEAEEARRKQREESRERRQAASAGDEAGDQPPSQRFNPYLAHIGEGDADGGIGDDEEDNA
jgi:hypothetical protein